MSRLRRTEAARGWASALRVRPCLLSVNRPSRKIAEKRIPDAMPFFEGAGHLDCGSRLPLSFSAACCGENFQGEGKTKTLRKSSVIHKPRPSWSDFRFGPHTLVVRFGLRTSQAFSHLAGVESPRSRITAGCDTQSGSRLPQSKAGQ